jgi:primary-amine oxidase
MLTKTLTGTIQMIVVATTASPSHHLPRTEDGITSGGSVAGVALLMWGGFDLKPRDLFDSTPLYP